jgi:transporter family-2 protein
MKTFILSLLAFTGGIFLALQAGINAQLGTLLKNPLLASVTTSFCSFIFALSAVSLSIKNSPDWVEIKQVPVYLWFSGGFFSVLGVSLYLYTIPKLGVSHIISLGLSGQILFAVVAGHFGWLALPLEPLTFKRLIGMIVMIIGVVLIHTK